LTGTDGCARSTVTRNDTEPVRYRACLGDSFKATAARLDAAFGTNADTFVPTTEPTPDPTPSPAGNGAEQPTPPGPKVRKDNGSFNWKSATRQVTIEAQDGKVAVVASVPLSTATSPFNKDLTIGQVLAALGAPASIERTDGTTPSVTLRYNTEAGTVAYSFVAADTELPPLEGSFDAVTSAYDNLPIVAYAAS